MAYPNFYQTPQFYQPQQMPQQMLQQMPQSVQQVPQMQSGGFMSIRSEQEARSYPVAPGSVMTFKIENQPYVCEKAQGFSQLEGPIFNKYRLVKEEPDLTQTEPQKETKLNNITYVEKSEFEAVLKQIEDLKKEIAELKEGV